MLGNEKLRGSEMKCSIILIMASCIALAGCDQKKDTGNNSAASSESGDASKASSSPNSVSSSVSEAAAPLPKLAVMCEYQGNARNSIVTDPANKRIYLRNALGGENTAEYSQMSDDYRSANGVISFTAKSAKAGQDPDKVDYEISSNKESLILEYNLNAVQEAEKCQAREDAEKADCATAGDIGACLAAKYNEHGTMGLCYTKTSGKNEKLDVTCQPSTDYDGELKAAEAAWDSSVAYWKANGN
jgi:hypothetical protein